MANDSATGKAGPFYANLSKSLTENPTFKRDQLPVNCQYSKFSNDLPRLARGSTGLTITLVAVIYAAQPAPLRDLFDEYR